MCSFLHTDDRLHVDGFAVFDLKSVISGPARGQGGTNAVLVRGVINQHTARPLQLSRMS